MVEKNIDIISIVGTRPEIIRVIRDLPNHLIVDTGQHYDDNMDNDFWKEREIIPGVNLGSKKFSEIAESIDKLIKEYDPKLIISYGDTRSSLLSALIAKENDIKVAHLEAGVRCFNMNMPEERNRVIIDSISDYLFCVNEKGKQNLLKENVQGEIFVVGDILYDNYVQKRKHDDYVLMTIHRKENQNRECLNNIFNDYKEEKGIVFPIHPVMRKYMSDTPKNVELIDPVNNLEMLELIKNAKLVITDSGGVQREAFFMGVPLDIRLNKNPWENEINVFGNGKAEEKIKSIIMLKVYGNKG